MAPTMQTLTEFPESFAAGTTVKYTRSLSDYPANDGWTLAVHLRGRTVEGSANATVAASGADYVVTFPATVTASLPAGGYTWIERVTKAGEVNDPATGTVDVTPNVAAATAAGLQTHAARTLAALQAKLEGRVTADQETLQVDGMAISRIEIDKLEALVRRYQAKVNAERRGGGVRVTPIAFSRHQ